MAQIATFPVESKRVRKATAESSLEKLESLLDTVEMIPCYNDGSLPSAFLSGTVTAILEILHDLMPHLKGDFVFQNQEVQNFYLTFFRKQEIQDFFQNILEDPELYRPQADSFVLFILRSSQILAHALRDSEQRKRTAQRSLKPGRRIMEAIPKIKGLREIIEKLPQNSSTPSTVISILCELNSILESLCKSPLPPSSSSLDV